MKGNRVETSILIFLLLFITAPATADYPLIQKTIAYQDALFRQHQTDAETWYYNTARGLPPPPLTIYRYQPKGDQSLIQLASLFNLPVDTLATINNLENIRDFNPESQLLIPSTPGLFLREPSDSGWSRELEKSVREQPFDSLTLIRENGKQKIRYYPGAYLPDSLRLKFIIPLFHPPLRKLTVTSPYGYRDHPVSGEWGLHTGTDYRALPGTDIYSCADGTILSTGELEDYGIFIIIKHNNGYTSMYSHLSKVLVSRGQQVNEGVIIGKSGNTGISTGPHLHFEIRKNGMPLDPGNLLPKGVQ